MDITNVKAFRYYIYYFASGVVWLMLLVVVLGGSQRFVTERAPFQYARVASLGFTVPEAFVVFLATVALLALSFAVGIIMFPMSTAFANFANDTVVKTKILPGSDRRWKIDSAAWSECKRLADQKWPGLRATSSPVEFLFIFIRRRDAALAEELTLNREVVHATSVFILPAPILMAILLSAAIDQTAWRIVLAGSLWLLIVVFAALELAGYALWWRERVVRAALILLLEEGPSSAASEPAA